ncbi:LysR family transcriptional regulator [Paraburkholderia sp. Ac-20336]|nr:MULTISPECIES: LysR substrate-binding domain-containing protein [unclassified Paraburkholderia]MBN3803063.1 LysR family transcriptional regulator [Paraburkholderia sp. Ac-20336]MBN3848244.1 LysR family transcriptional regulator [Paraburkholderia sp. Ac-20342]
MTQIRHFVSVVEHGGFKAAAAAVFRSQPALSLSIRELETTLGARLLERGNRVMLTAFGTLFYREAKSLVEHYDRAIQAAIDVAQVRLGRVKIAAVPSIAHEILPRAISRFVRSYPTVNLHVEDGSTIYVHERVKSGTVDFGIASEPDSSSGLRFSPLLADALCAVVPAGHPLFKRKKLKWPQLAASRIIGNGIMQALSPDVRAAIGQPESLFIPNTTTLLAAVENGVGVTVLPFLSNQHNGESLRFIPLESPRVERLVGIVEPEDKSPSPAALALRNGIVEEVQALAPCPEVRRLRSGSA